jgi:hypothetical protein
MITVGLSWAKLVLAKKSIIVNNSARIIFSMLTKNLIVGNYTVIASRLTTDESVHCRIDQHAGEAYLSSFL